LLVKIKKIKQDDIHFTKKDSLKFICLSAEKKRILQLLRSKEIQDIVKCFGGMSSDQDSIGNADSALTVKMFGGNPDTTLRQLRYHKYMESIATHSSLQLELLPPIERAIYFLSLRVHLQVCQWRFLSLDYVDLIKWGWQKYVDTLKPIKTDLQPAPEIILNFIRCKCRSSTTNMCGTNKCTS